MFPYFVRMPQDLCEAAGERCIRLYLFLLLSLLFWGVCEKWACRLESVWCLTGNLKQTSDWVTPSQSVRRILSFRDCLSEYAAQILQLLLFFSRSIFDSSRKHKHQREISKQLKTSSLPLVVVAASLLSHQTSRHVHSNACFMLWLEMPVQLWHVR